MNHSTARTGALGVLSVVVVFAAAVAFATVARAGGTAATGAGSGSSKPAAGSASTPAASTPAAGSGSGSAAGAGSGSGSAVATAPATPPNPDDVPINLRLRKIEQRVQALKERAWQAKAHIAMIKEAVIGGGIGAQASISHENKMGSSFRLIKLVYALDGTQVFSKVDDDAETLYKETNFDIVTGPIAPGSHTLSVLAVYRGHGFGVFKYLEKYTFTVRSSHTFTVSEGKATKVTATAFEKGKANTPLEKRPAIDFKVEQIEPEKIAPATQPTAAPATTTTPAASGAPAPAPAPTTTTPTTTTTTPGK